MPKLTEKRLYRILPQTLTSNGSVSGQITIADTKQFVVGHIVVLRSSTQPNFTLKVKRIPNSTTMFLGPVNAPIHIYEDVSAYLAADFAVIEAEEQNRPSVPQQEIERHTYAEEPTVARRVTLIDPYGDNYDDDNPVPVSATITPSVIDTPTILNVPVPLAGTEYSQALPTNTAILYFRSRDPAKIQFSYIPGTTATNFFTLMPGNIFKEEGLILIGQTLYFRSTKPTTLEILAWT